MPLHKAAILFLGAFSGFRYSPRLQRGSNMRSIRGAVIWFIKKESMLASNLIYLKDIRKYVRLNN